MTKIVFFDVDGTLLEMGCKHLSDKTIYALNKLKENGIKIFIATGRPTAIAPHFDEVEFDGIIAFNGQLCQEGNTIIYQNHMDSSDVQTLYQNAIDMNITLCLADENTIHTNYIDAPFQRYMDFINFNAPSIPDFDQYVSHNIFQAIVAIDPDKDTNILKGCEHMQIARWCDIACDIIPDTGGKDIGIQKILEYYNYSKEESMSFGDGHNDISMLQATGIGIAMGNAKEEVKAMADYITLDVKEDGIYHALKHYKLID